MLRPYSDGRHAHRLRGGTLDQVHGSAERMNPGQRRMAVYRYGPSWGRLRYPFEISEPMLARLTPERRTIIEPQPQSLVPPGAAA
jgi:hypothetical protein